MKNIKHMEKWIWLPCEKYPEHQTTPSYSCDGSGKVTVAEFKREYRYEKRVVSAALRFSGDTTFELYCNGGLVATGPASVGGDFIGNESARENYYAFEKEICPDTETLSFYARVELTPIRICDFSKGHGGFMLFGILTFEDGTRDIITTDNSWLVRRNGAFTSPWDFDGQIEPDEYVCAEVIPNIWHTQNAPIPPRIEEELYPEGHTVTLAPHESREALMELDMIYAGYLRIRAECEGALSVTVSFCETDDRRNPVRVRMIRSGEYRATTIDSAGSLFVELKNDSDSEARVTVTFIATCYPVDVDAVTETDDAELDRVLSVCKHTLKYCRQTHHLDSPKHCEPLACTGDYYIESLMTVFSFGDMRLAEFDVLRTAELLVREDGRMFHTTYSLIWARMLYDVYMLTGNDALLEDCEEALMLLLRRFATYVGENGLIENPPDYMFVDWIYIDGFSMHHPPKALGQTCLNMFYFGALDAAVKIYSALGRDSMSRDCGERREALRHAIQTHLFDEERGIYFEGLNTPERKECIGWSLPENTEKRYYLKHSNILAAYFGVCDDRLGRALVHKIMTDEIEGDFQPYFAHYLFEAIFRLGLCEEYTIKLCERWKAPIAECSKGLVEGFVTPEPTYSFDHSHAWGGTPLYSLPKALLGLEILEPGMKRIALSPSLLGMKRARVELPTPYGMLTLEMREGEKPLLCCPNEIRVGSDS
ncbi:MAG: hypothetical protein IJY39_08810 [Clostridia bacterium]|nr:hypothetical protein [Clostridia bacterium]